MIRTPTVLFCLLSTYATGQSTDIFPAGGHVYEVRKGSLTEITITSGSATKKTLTTPSSVKAASASHEGKIIFADTENVIWQSDTEGKWKTIGKLKFSVYSLHYADDKLFALTEEGIIDVENDKLYFSEESLNHQITYKKPSWGHPSCSFLDFAGKIWFGFDYGEWGGNLKIFDTRALKWQTPILDSTQLELLPVISIFGDGNEVYVTGGVAHMSTHGSILKFDGMTGSTVFQSRSGYGPPKASNKRTWINGEFIGPGAINPVSKQLYFYSQNGFFRGDPLKVPSTIDSWVLIGKPSLEWTAGRPVAVGPAINVIEIIAINETDFIFLSTNNGLGYYHGGEFGFIK